MKGILNHAEYRHYHAAITELLTDIMVIFQIGQVCWIETGWIV